jgi:hypothetical protein
VSKSVEDMTSALATHAQRLKISTIHQLEYGLRIGTGIVALAPYLSAETRQYFVEALTGQRNNLESAIEALELIGEDIASFGEVLEELGQRIKELEKGND